jgi:thiosulfate/3-mercaptopyruvate sulfurtransferase
MYPFRQELLVSAEELASSLGDETLCIIDCRFDLLDPLAGREEYLAAHIPGAVYADLDRDLAAPVKPNTGRHPLPDTRTATGTFRRFGINRDSNVVVYDSCGGAMAARAWWMLRWLGHERVKLLDGGFPGWHAKKLATSHGPEKVPEGDFMAGPISTRVLTTADLVEAMSCGDWPVIIDARDAARFRGEVEPIDAIAGHIPGTLNLPFVDTLDDEGKFRQPETLKRLWRRALGEDRDTAWCAMCGSGVTACHLAISAQLAGYREPALYAGSWSEWIRDPARPVATGGP